MTFIPNGCSYVPPPLCSAPGPSSTPGTIPVVNVQDFIDLGCGAMPSGGVRTREAIRAAAESIPTTGGILYFPPGLYEMESDFCRPILIKSRTWVMGAGRATRLKNSTVGGVILDVIGVVDVRISGIAFDVNRGVCDWPNTPNGNFSAAVRIGPELDANTQQLTPAQRIVVEGCFFATTGELVRSQTLHAVLAQGEDIWIRDNVIRHMQMKTGGARCSRVYVQDNHFVDPYNFAVSFVVPQGGELRDAFITGNLVENLPSQGGFFVGTDGENGVGQLCANLVIRDNIIRGAWSEASMTDLDCEGTAKLGGSATGILIHVPSLAKNWVIEGNVLDNTGPVASNSLGIAIKPRRTGLPSMLEGLVVRRNSIRGVDQAGIALGSPARDFVIAANVLERTRGIFVYGSAEGSACGSIHDNVVSGQHFGLSLIATDGDLSGITARDNLLRDTVGGTYQAISLQVGNAHSIAADVVSNGVEGVMDGQSIGVHELVLAGGGTFTGTRYLDNDLVASQPVVRPAGSASTVRANRGCRTEAKGTQVIAAFQSEVTFAHGLSPQAATSLASVDVTPTVDVGAGLVWVSACDATNVTVRRAPAAATPLTFGWSARG